MSKWKIVMIAAVVLIGGVSGAKADPTPIVVTFEGVGNLAPVSGFYNGGAGGSLGIVFGPGAMGLVSLTAGGNGNFTGQPSGVTVGFFVPGTSDFMNVPAGFSTGFSFFYSAAIVPGSVTIWSGLDGAGSLLATLNLPLNDSACPVNLAGLVSCVWTPIGTSFAGTAESVDFSGATGIGFDDVTLGSGTPGTGGPTPTPEPATTLLLGVGSVGLLRARRSKAC